MQTITAIITVHKSRKQYLPQALASVLAQETGNFKLETVVVADYEDDTSGLATGVRWVSVDNESLGAKIAEGIEESKGDVIALLEDDDVWLPGKLRFVASRFKEVRGLAFLHHLYLTTYDDLTPITKTIRGCYERVLLDPSRGARNLKLLYPYCVANNSSIAISREAAEGIIEGLRRIPGASGVDRFIFAGSLAYGPALHEPRVLTLYRRPGLLPGRGKPAGLTEEGLEYLKWSRIASCGDLVAIAEGARILARAKLMGIARFFEKYAISSAISCSLAQLALSKKGAKPGEAYWSFGRALLEGAFMLTGPAPFLDGILSLLAPFKTFDKLIMPALALLHRPRR